MCQVPGRSRGRIQPALVGIGVLSDVGTCYGASTDVASPLSWARRYLHALLCPQLEETATTLQGRQHVTLEDSRKGVKGSGWAVVSITCLIRTCIQVPYKVPDCPV